MIRKSIRTYVRTYLPLMQTAILLRRLTTGRSAQNRIVLFHVGRCGSTVLSDLLAQHKNLYWGGELFNDGKLAESPGFRPTPGWIRAMIELSAQRGGHEHFGFESRIHDFRPDRVPLSIPEFVAFLENLGFRHFVVLRRNNLLRIVISANVAGQTRQMQVLQSPSAPTRVRVDPAQPWAEWGWEGSLTTILDRLDRFYSDVEQAVAGRKGLTLAYENDIEGDPRVAYRKVCELAGLQPMAVNVRLSRVNPFGIEQMISNYDEVATALRGTRHEWMLGA